MVLSCIPLMTKDIENFFMCLFGIHVFSLVKYLFASFTHLKNQVVCLLIIGFKKISSGDEFFIRYTVYKYFLPLCGFPLFFLEVCFKDHKVFDLMKSNFVFFYAVISDSFRAHSFVPFLSQPTVLSSLISNV